MPAATNTVKPLMVDGARHSLLGYLYQLVTVAGLKAWAAGAGEDDLRAPTLLAWVRDGVLTSELFDQDAGVESGAAGAPQVRVMIQVKHSDHPATDIDLEDFAELLHGFARSERLAAAAGWAVDRFTVVTNRHRAGRVGRIWDSRSAAE